MNPTPAQEAAQILSTMVAIHHSQRGMEKQGVNFILSQRAAMDIAVAKAEDWLAANVKPFFTPVQD